MASTLEKINLGEKVKVKMLTSVAGTKLPKYGLLSDFTFLHDQTVSIHPELAEHWQNSGQCEILPK